MICRTLTTPPWIAEPKSTNLKVIKFNFLSLQNVAQKLKNKTDFSSTKWPTSSQAIRSASWPIPKSSSLRLAVKHRRLGTAPCSRLCGWNFARGNTKRFAMKTKISSNDCKSSAAITTSLSGTRSDVILSVVSKWFASLSHPFQLSKRGADKADADVIWLQRQVQWLTNQRTQTVTSMICTKNRFVSNLKRKTDKLCQVETLPTRHLKLSHQTTKRKTMSLLWSHKIKFYRPYPRSSRSSLCLMMSSWSWEMFSRCNHKKWN